MKRSTYALLLAAVLALGSLAPMATALPTQGRRLLKGGVSGGGGTGIKHSGGAEFEAPEVEDGEDGTGGTSDDPFKGVVYTRDDYEKAKTRKKGEDDAPAPAPGPGGPGAGPGTPPGGPGPAGPGPTNNPPTGTPGSGIGPPNKGDDSPKGPKSPGLPLGPTSGGDIKPSSDCTLRGRKYRICFKLEDGVMVYFTVKDKKVDAAFSAANSGNWAAFLLGDVNGNNPAVLAQTCGKECATGKGATAKGGYTLANYTGKSAIKFKGVKAYLTADGIYQVPFTFEFPKGEKAIKVSVARDNGAGAVITKVITVTKAALMA